MAQPSSLAQMVGPTLFRVDGVDVAVRTYRNFVGVTVTDDADGDETTFTINAMAATTSTTFQIDSAADGPVLKDDAGALAVRNELDTAYESVIALEFVMSETGARLTQEGTALAVRNQGDTDYESVIAITVELTADEAVEMRVGSNTRGDGLTMVHQGAGQDVVEYGWDESANAFGYSRDAGATWTHMADSRGWTRIPTASYTATAASSSTLTMAVDHRTELRIGTPVRVYDRTGVEEQDAQTVLSGWENTVVNAGSLAMSGGRLWIKIVDDTGGYRHLEAYEDAAMAAGDKVGHTATWNSTGAKTWVADGTRPCSGTITVDTTTVTGMPVTCIVCYFRYAIVTAATATLLTLRGAVMSTSASRIAGLWFGDTGKVAQFALPLLPGAFATATSDALNDQCNYYLPYQGPPARAVGMLAKAKAVASTYAKANAMLGATAFCTANSGDGLELTSTSAFETTTDITQLNSLAFGDVIEIKVTTGNAGNENLSTHLTLVLE